jgi:hypothetical protein
LKLDKLDGHFTHSGELSPQHNGVGNKVHNLLARYQPSELLLTYKQQIMYKINNLGVQALVNFFILLEGKNANFVDIQHKGTRSETMSMTFVATMSELDMVKLMGEASRFLTKISDGGIEEADAKSEELAKLYK